MTTERPSLAVEAARVLALAALYATVAILSLRLDAVSGFATLVWPPTGISLAALLLFGRRLWPGIALGALVANVVNGAPPLVAAGIAVGNSLEAVVGVWALQRVRGFRLELSRLNDVVALVLLAAIFSPVISASIGTASLIIGGVVDSTAFFTTWRAWWLGDAVGALIVAPLLLAWATGPWPRPTAWRVIEGGALVAAVVGVASLVFLGSWHPSAAVATEQLLAPVLIWAAIRFSQRGATAATFLASVIAIWGTALGGGPFTQARLAESLIALQAFMAVQSTTFLLLAAVVLERSALLDRATAAVIARDDNLAIVSHELGNPLTTIAVTADLMAGAADTRTQSQASRIHRAADRMRRLVRDLLDASRIEAGQLPLVKKRCTASALLRESAEACRPAADQQSVQLDVRDPSAPLELDCDEGRILQVLANLLGNALKVAPAGSTIALEASLVEGNARFTVTDSGGGIPPEHAAHVFERYWRGTEQGREGAGLGLYIARNIIEAHGGKLQFETRAGVGTTFTFTLAVQGQAH